MTAGDGVTAAIDPASSGSRLDRLRDATRRPARDIRLNLQSGSAPGSADAGSTGGGGGGLGGGLANPRLQEAVIGDARRRGWDAAVIDDAVAAATLMAMNNVYYRFRHLVEKPSYTEKPARLRMNRLARPATTKLAFELTRWRRARSAAAGPARRRTSGWSWPAA